MAARFRAIRAEAADFGTNCLVSVAVRRLGSCPVGLFRASVLGGRLR